jgi:uncharacterized membrane protein
MERLKGFLKTSLLGGLVVILPVAILASVSAWVFRLVTGWIEPLTQRLIADSQLNEYAAQSMVIVIIIALCFIVGMLVRTRLGGFLFRLIEQRIFRLAPGYTLIRDTVMQLLGGEGRSAFSAVAIARPFGNETSVTAFVTDTHPDGSYTLFVPTGPNPTSGLIYHVSADLVECVDVPVQEAMRTIISCGAGTSRLLHEHIASSRHGVSVADNN